MKTSNDTPNRIDCSNAHVGSENRSKDEGKAKLLDLSHKLHTLSVLVGYQALLASYGFPYELQLLRETRDNFDTALNNFFNGDAKSDKATWPLIQAEYLAIRAIWSGSMRMNVEQILSQEKRLLALPSYIDRIRLATDRLSYVSGEVVELGALHSARADLLYIAQRQDYLSQRIHKSAILFGQALIPEDESSTKRKSIAAAQLLKDIGLLKETHARLREKMPKAVIPKLDEAGTAIEEVDRPVSSIINTSSEIYVSLLAARLINEQSQSLGKNTRRLVEKIRNMPKMQQ